MTIKISSDAFRSFLDENRDYYPYNQFKRTRNQYHVPYIISTDTYISIQQTTDLDNNYLQEAFCVGEVVPFPEEFSEINACIRRHPQSHESSIWHQRVLEYAVSLSQDQKPNPPSRKKLFKRCLLLWVRVLLQANMVWPRFMELSLQYQWLESFKRSYTDDDSFRYLTDETTAYIQNKIDAYHQPLETDVEYEISEASSSTSESD